MARPRGAVVGGTAPTCDGRIIAGGGQRRGGSRPAQRQLVERTVALAKGKASVLAGCVVMLGGTGAGLTVNVAAVLVTLPPPFDTTTL